MNSPAIAYLSLKKREVSYGNGRGTLAQATFTLNVSFMWINPTLNVDNNSAMAKSVPYANPKKHATNSIDTLIAEAGKLLTTGGKIMEKMARHNEQSLALLCNKHLAAMVKIDRQGSKASKVLRSLNSDTAPTEMPTVLRGFVEGMVSNTYVDRMVSYNNKTIDSRQRQMHAKHRELMLMNLASLLTRIRSMHALPLNSIRRGIENKYLGCPTHLWNIARAYREVPGEKWVDDALAAPSVMAWRAPPREPLSTELDMCCRDNLEWYRSVKFTRHKDGKKLENELLHTVTGEHFHIPASLVDHLPDPQLGNNWPFMGTYNYSDAVVTGEEMNVFLQPLWGKMLALQSGNSMQLMMRPPAEADRVKWGNNPTKTWHPPIVLYCGTSSYVDNAKIVKNVRASRVGKKSVIACDMQTFVRMWWLKAKFPQEFNDIVPMAGEFHGLAHLTDGIVILNWCYILEPILLHFDVKGFHLSLNMKETSQRIRWITLILCAGIEWMVAIFRPEELNDIPKLLEKVKGNVPVWAFVGFLYYHASMVWGTKEAIQTGDVHMLDFMWRFSLRVYAQTNKTNYKKGCIQQMRVLNDSEPRVRALAVHHRTCNDTGRPCAGTALDYKNEKVRYFFVL